MMIMQNQILKITELLAEKTQDGNQKAIDELKGLRDRVNDLMGDNETLHFQLAKSNDKISLLEETVHECGAYAEREDRNLKRLKAQEIMIDELKEDLEISKGLIRNG